MSKESLCLRGATNQATEDQVRLKLGEPKTTKLTQVGDSVWVYEVRAAESKLLVDTGVLV